MAHPNPDHPSFGTQPALYGLPSLPAPGTSPLRRAVEARESPTLTQLVPMVGGVDALAALHAEPWPADDIDWSETGAGRERALEVLAVVEARIGVWLGAELRDVVRRLVVRSATVDGAGFAKGPIERTAAALAWLAIVANAPARTDRALPPSLVWRLFDVTDCAARGRALHAGLGLAPDARPTSFAPAAASVWIADPRFLTASTRSWLCALRDAALRSVDEARARAPISALDGGRVQLRARPLSPAWAFRGTAETGRDFVAVAFDDGTDRPHLVALSVPEARELVHLLGDALDGPVRTRRLGS